MSRPALHRLDAPGSTTALILMLHGGQQASREPVDHTSASWQRSRLMQRRIARRAHAAGASLWLLRYRHRGWNAAAEPSPVPDARWALEQVRRAHGPVPVVLLGHSMGARTAVAVADDPSVTAVVGLAPWWPPREPVRTLAGKHLAAAHGRADPITSLDATEAYLRRASAVARSTELVDMGGLGHYMVRGMGTWDRFAVSRSLAFLDQHADRPGG